MAIGTSRGPLPQAGPPTLRPLGVFILAADRSNCLWGLEGRDGDVAKRDAARVGVPRGRRAVNIPHGAVDARRSGPPLLRFFYEAQPIAKRRRR